MNLSREDLIILAAAMLHGNGRSVPENVKKALEIEAEVKKQRESQCLVPAGYTNSRGPGA